jgi:hypothetical protein
MRPYQQQPRPPTVGIRAPQSRRPNLWVRMTSPHADMPPRTIDERERLRRARLASYIVLSVLIVDILLIPLGLGDPVGTLLPVVGGGAFILVAALFNRLGNVAVTALLLIAIINGAVSASLLSQPTGLTTDALPAFDLLVISVVVGASLLPRVAAFIVAFANIAIIALLFFLTPHAPDLTHELTDPAVLGGGAVAVAALLGRPIALQIVIAIVAYLWVRGTDDAIRRADRAEEIAALEHTLADQKRQLDIGIQQILQTHVRAANGDYSARAPLGQDNLLWQIASSLNNLLSRLQRTGQAEYQLRRTDEELRRLAAAIDDAQAGRKPVWPAPTGTSADFIIERITRTGRRAQPIVQEHRPPSGPSQPMSGFPPSGPRSWQDQMRPAPQAPAGWPDHMQPAQPVPPPPFGWQDGPPQPQQPAEPQQDGGWSPQMDPPMSESGSPSANPWAFPQDDH